MTTCKKSRWLLLAWVAGACEASVETPIGLFEPIVVHEGQLQTKHLKTNQSADLAPEVLSIETASQTLTHAQRGRALAGRVSERAHAVAVRIVDQGSNWWIVPAGSVDPDFPDQRAFALTFDVGKSIPAGPYALAVAAVDKNGQLGTPSTLDVCVVDAGKPSNFNVCSPGQKPPELTVNLEWDADVDLDLVVVTPSGETIAWKTPGASISDPKKAAGRLLRDANAQCQLDRRNVESVVFDKEVVLGTYLVYANLFAACDQPAVLFAANAQRGIDNGDGTFRQVEIHRSYGALIDQQASNFNTQALYLGAFEVR